MQRARWAVIGAIIVVALYGRCSVTPPTAEAPGQGYDPNPAGTRAFLAELEQPLFRDAGREVIQESHGIDTFLYRSMYKAHEARYGTPLRPGNQSSIGSCVGWGFSGAAYCSLCVAWDEGEIPEPPLLVSPTSCYGGSRVEARGKPEGAGGYRDGSYGGAAAKWMSQWGLIFRENVGGHDLTEYSVSRCREWGNWGNGGEGDNGALDKIAKRHPALHVALVTGFDEAAAAIESGFPIAICSGVGFTRTRSEGGWCERSGSWAHCMYACAVRYKKNGSKDDGLLLVNSWGDYVQGPKWPSDQPDGTFWVTRDVVDLMLGKWRDSFAIGSVQGFPYRELHHEEWLDVPQ